MKRRALGAAFAAALISALTGSLAWADNPHGTPPGQAANDSTSAGVTASASADNRGQAKKADDAAAGNSASANSDEHASSQTTAASNTSASNDSQTKQTPGGSKFDNCSGTPNTSGSPGVKPSSDTDKWTCATAGSNQTKEYGNGTTAGQGVMSRPGGNASIMLRGPGNSQPHMVQPCPGSRHWRDWHAVKSYGTSAPCTNSSPGSQPATCASGQTMVNGVCTSAQTSSNTNTSSNVSSNTSVTNNSVTNNSVTNNSTTNNSTTTSSVTNNASTSPTAPSTSGVQGAQHSSAPAKTTKPAAPSSATSPASSTAPAAATSPASTNGVLGTTASSRSTLPFTGLPLWLPALLALGLAAGGFGLVRFGRARL